MGRRMVRSTVIDTRFLAQPSPEVETVGLCDEVPSGTEKRSAIDEAFRRVPSYVRNTGIPLCRVLGTSKSPRGLRLLARRFQPRAEVEHRSARRLLHRWPCVCLHCGRLIPQPPSSNLYDSGRVVDDAWRAVQVAPFPGVPCHHHHAATPNQLKCLADFHSALSELNFGLVPR